MGWVGQIDVAMSCGRHIEYSSRLLCDWVNRSMDVARWMLPWRTDGCCHGIGWTDGCCHGGQMDVAMALGGQMDVAMG